MATNIIRTKLKEIRDFEMPFDLMLQRIEKLKQNGWSDRLIKYDRANEKGQPVDIHDGFIKGNVHRDGRIVIESINLRSDFSGRFYDVVLKPLFSESSGALRMTLIWEGGDVVKVCVVAGILNEEEVDV